METDVRCVVLELVGRGTEPPFAAAAIADAEIPRICGKPFAAMQPVASKRSLMPSIKRRIHTDPSLRATRFGKQRDNPA